MGASINGRVTLHILEADIVTLVIRLNLEESSELHTQAIVLPLWFILFFFEYLITPLGYLYPKSRYREESCISKDKELLQRLRKRDLTEFELRKYKHIKSLLLSHFGLKCMKCGNHKKDLHLDHIEPVSRNPSRFFDTRNMQILCVDCNLKKGYEYDLKKWDCRTAEDVSNIVSFIASKIPSKDLLKLPYAKENGILKRKLRTKKKQRRKRKRKNFNGNKHLPDFSNIEPKSKEEQLKAIKDIL